MKEILLTGGCGFIGSHTAVELLLEGYSLIIVDNLDNSNYDVIRKIKEIVKLEDRISFFNYDITNRENLEIIFKHHPNIEAVIHFAAYKAVSESVAEPLKYYKNNLVGLLNLLDCMKKYNVYNFIFSSSATVYGNPESLPLTEESSLSTLNPYGNTKLFGEEILKDVSNITNIKTIILRYFNPVGAHPSGLIGESPKGIPNNLFPYILSVIRKEIDHLHVFGNDYPTKDGTGVRDYIHVVDLAKGHVAALKHIHNVDNYDIFNLGTGNGYSVLEIVNKFSELLEYEVPHIITERRYGDSAEVYADCSKASNILNWKAELNLENMVRDTLNFIK